jgi:hypothetical protein
MSSDDGHLRAAADYREAAETVRYAAGTEEVELEPAAVDTLTDNSVELGKQTAAGLKSASADVRQLAALQLQAQAALDLDLANRIIEQAQAEVETVMPMAADTRLSDDELTALHVIVSVPQHRGVSSLLEHPTLLTAEVADPAALKAAMEGAIKTVSDDAGKAAADTLANLRKLPGETLENAAAKVVGEVLELAGVHLGMWVKKAANLVVAASAKLLKLFGVDADSARKKVAEWFDKLDAAKVTELLDVHLYHVDDRKKDLGARIDKDGPAASPDALQAGVNTINSLSGSFHKQMWVVDKVAWALSKTQRWIAGAAKPWGATVLAVGESLVIAYSVCGGGDYLDWSESGLLDLVDGVDRAVNKALAPVPAPAV